eukprot:TRINITY_DN60831_c0_g1_i1.p1 TRINITY_DN60831_c0_g1~~TRINITY_DN60831_c0_g1_i1.p1  ORF type:complete len:739 (+),score=334.44 TRINITY_DN60831_c0_g1_i1:65-2218(+)
MPSRWMLSTLSAALVALAAVQAACAEKTVLLTVAPGVTLRGTVHEELGVKLFRGVPFAKPPVGDLRFRPPVPAWPYAKGEEIDATKFGATCLQAGSGFSSASSGFSSASSDVVVSEDCLTLSVWMPSSVRVNKDTRTVDMPDEPLAVMVWLHGGGFSMGSSYHPFTSPDPSTFAERNNVIVVSPHYRIGALGFLGLPSLTEESGTSGVYGIQDQQLALRWVQRFVSSFGGSPSRVAVFGNSAGAVSLCIHLISEGSQGLFQRAVLLSGQCDYPLMSLRPEKLNFLPIVTTDVYRQSELLAVAAGCASPDKYTLVTPTNYHREPTAEDREEDRRVLECLRRLDAQTLQTALPERRGLLFHEGYYWTPAIDGVVVPDRPGRYLRQHGVLDPSIDVVVGNTADEGTLFTFTGYPLYLFDSVGQEFIDNIFPAGYADTMRWEYRHWYWTGGMRDMLSRMLSDFAVCSSRNAADAIYQSQEKRRKELANAADESDDNDNDSKVGQVYVYQFAHAPHNVEWPLEQCGALHGIDLRYMFRVERSARIADVLSDEEDALADFHMQVFGNFAKHGSPNADDKHPVWPAYKPVDEQLARDAKLAARNVFIFNHTSSERPDQCLGTSAHSVGDAEDSRRFPFYRCDLWDRYLATSGVPVLPPLPEPSYSFVLNSVTMRMLVWMCDHPASFIACFGPLCLALFYLCMTKNTKVVLERRKSQRMLLLKEE